MRRRSVLAAALGATGAVFAAVRASRASGGVADATKVVYHLADTDKVDFVLGNIRNHLDGMGGPDKVTIALVVHGPALKAFHAAAASAEVARRTAEFSKAGVAFNACARTMKGQGVTLGDLLPGFVSAEKGGVVRLAELQAQGYVYLRP